MIIFDNFTPDGKVIEESEDCLYLNVYAPPSASLTNPKAVIFWIFGVSSCSLKSCDGLKVLTLTVKGSFASGGASQSAYDGASFAVNNDIVVVTINYRTNSKSVQQENPIPMIEKKKKKEKKKEKKEAHR